MSLKKNIFLLATALTIALPGACCLMGDTVTGSSGTAEPGLISAGDIILISSVIIIISLLIFLRKFLKEIKKTNDRISRLKHETDKKLIDGIFYAQSLQQSLLPEEDILRETTQDYFILYMPKDLVSGDFYWYKDFGGYSIAAVIDCTGHGIPGGFMSMIGSTLLNRVIIEKQNYDPSEILERMDEGIRDILKQDEEGSEADDGMEVCICRIDKPGRKVVFAGAHRPLLYYSGGKMNEIRGTRRAIGGRPRKGERKPYTNNVIPITDDTVVYLTTDGMADQNDAFGNKFGKARLFRAIEASSNLPMIEQKYKIINELNSFRRSILQRDDITIIGIKP